MRGHLGGQSSDKIKYLGEVGKKICSMDWSKTSLGDIKNWSAALKTSVSLCTSSQFPVAIWWGRDLISIYNDAFSNLLGLSITDALGKNPEHIWKIGGKDFVSTLENVLSTGKANELQKKVSEITSKKTGELLTFYNSPIHDESGKVSGVFSIVVSKEKAVEDEAKTTELKRSEERFIKMTEEVQDYAIILLDKDGTILNWNKGAQAIKGYKEDEIIGKNFSVFYLDEDRKSRLPESLIRQAEEKGRAMHEGWRKRKDGTRFWGSIVITALHSENNDVIGFTKVTRDLTERKAAEDMMRQHASELEIKNRQLEQFAYIASHDLQEPLRKIQTFVQVLERKIDQPDTRQKYFSKINASAQRMADLIKSVLNYSRLSKTEEYWTMTDLSEVLENVKSDYELLIGEKNAVIESDPLPIIKAIPHQINQLFSNLIGNSLKFSRNSPVISISANIIKANELPNNVPLTERSKKYLELVFKDNGIGFEQQYAEKIFTIFQRLNSRDEYAGTGIGLALCKRIVDNHEGFIEAQGRLGAGASFIIYLPME